MRHDMILRDAIVQFGSSQKIKQARCSKMRGVMNYTTYSIYFLYL